MSEPCDVIELEGADPAPKCGCGAPLVWVDCVFCADGQLTPGMIVRDEETDEPFCAECRGVAGWFTCDACDG